MATFVEIIHSHNDKPIKNAQIVLRYQDGSQVSQRTNEKGIASFDRVGLVSITVNNKVHQSQIELEENETTTIAIDRNGLPKIKRSKKIRIRTVNPNPILPANQVATRQAILRVEAPKTKPKMSRPSFNISLVLDFSQSMLGSKIDLITEAIVHVLEEVKEQDRVSIVTFHEQVEVRLPSRKLTTEAKGQLINQLRNINDFASLANLSEGWRVGFQQIMDHWTDETSNWVLIFTDGLADVGITDQVGLVEQARQFQQQGVSCYTFGVGPDCNQTLLTKMAQSGGGKFYFIDDLDKVPSYLRSWFSKIEPKVHVGHNVTIDVNIPNQVQLTLLHGVRHQKVGTIFRISLGEMFTRQKYQLPISLQFPPYPIGKQTCLNIKLYYHDPQKNMMPVTVKALPLCFMVVDQPEDRRPDNPPPPPPAVPHIPPEQVSSTQISPPDSNYSTSPTTMESASTLTSATSSTPFFVGPIAALLSGSVLFLIGAVTVISMLLMVPEDEVERVVVVGDTASQPVILIEGTDTPEVIDVTSTATDVAPTVTSAVGDVIVLPTTTPTHTPVRQPIATDTPVVESTETNTLIPVTAVPQPVNPSSSSSQPVQAVEGLAIGNLAPDFTLGSHRAERVSLSELRGKGVVLNFWASWCPPCQYEVPDLESIHNEYGPQGIVVLAVNQGESLETVERFAWDNGVHFNVWLDEDKWAGHIYSVRAIPTTYFIDKDGIIRHVKVGTMSHNYILQHLQKILPN